MTRKILMVEENRQKVIVQAKTMKDSLPNSESMFQNGAHYPREHKTPDYRLISNPFDPPTSVHLRQRLASFSIFDEVSVQSFSSSIHQMFFDNSGTG